MALDIGGVMGVALSYKINVFNKMHDTKDFQQASLLSCIPTVFSQPHPLNNVRSKEEFGFIGAVRLG